MDPDAPPADGPADNGAAESGSGAAGIADGIADGISSDISEDISEDISRDPPERTETDTGGWEGFATHANGDLYEQPEEQPVIPERGTATGEMQMTDVHAGQQPQPRRKGMTGRILRTAAGLVLLAVLIGGAGLSIRQAGLAPAPLAPALDSLHSATMAAYRTVSSLAGGAPDPEQPAGQTALFPPQEGTSRIPSGAAEDMTAQTPEEGQMQGQTASEPAPQPEDRTPTAVPDADGIAQNGRNDSMHDSMQDGMAAQTAQPAGASTPQVPAGQDSIQTGSLREAMKEPVLPPDIVTKAELQDVIDMIGTQTQALGEMRAHLDDSVVRINSVLQAVNKRLSDAERKDPDIAILAGRLNAAETLLADMDAQAAGAEAQFEEIRTALAKPPVAPPEVMQSLSDISTNFQDLRRDLSIVTNLAFSRRNPFTGAPMPQVSDSLSAGPPLSQEPAAPAVPPALPQTGYGVPPLSDPQPSVGIYRRTDGQAVATQAVQRAMQQAALAKPGDFIAGYGHVISVTRSRDGSVRTVTENGTIEIPAVPQQRTEAQQSAAADSAAAVQDSTPNGTEPPSEQ